MKEGRYSSLLKAEPYSVKEAVLLCFFMLGLEFPVALIFRYLLPDLDLVYCVFSFTLALVIVRICGKGFLRRLLKFRPIELPVFFSLLIMYLGFEIISTELLNLFKLLLPVPESFFGRAGSVSVGLTILNGAVFPALSEEIVFRGVILNRLCVKYGERKAIVASSLLFGPLAVYEEKTYPLCIMIDGVLIDTFSLQARQFAVRWKEQIRKSPHLKHYNGLDDETLIESDMVFYPLLARTLSRGVDRSLLGGFFVDLGKKRMGDGFPISELIYAVNLAQKVVIEYIMTDYAPENTLRMYQSMGIMTEVAEFFLLGCFYLTKGFLEATYTRMNSNDNVSRELLNKYFRDDFFFKQN